MTTYPTQMYASSRQGQTNNSDGVVLQPMVSNSHRYQPLIEHDAPAATSTLRKPTATMYTVGNGYEPIATQYLPTKTDPGVYYINPGQTEQQPVIKQNREVTLLHPPERQSGTTIVFPEPGVVPQPVLYSIVDGKAPSTADPRISISKEQPASTHYPVNSRSRPIETIDNTLHGSTYIVDKYPTLYSLVDNARPRTDVPESPNQKHLQSSYDVQANQPNSVQPVPVLYSLISEISTPATLPRGNSSLPAAPSSSSRDPAVYTLSSEAKILRVQDPQSSPMPKPTLYTLVARQSSPLLYENVPKLPASVLMTTPHSSRSVQRKSEIIPEEIILQPATKPKRQSELKEPLISKPELIAFPVANDEYRSYPLMARQTTVSYTNPEQSARKPNTLSQHVTVKASDQYRLVTTNPTPKHQSMTTNPLSIMSNNPPEKKERPSLYEPRRQVGRHSYAASQAPRVVKYPATTIRIHSKSLDREYHSQTDDDEYERRINRQNRVSKTTRPLWIPAW